MWTWLVETLRHHPEMALFLTLALGYWIGKIRLGSITLGTVVGVLIAGVVIGQLGITISREPQDRLLPALSVRDRLSNRPAILQRPSGQRSAAGGAHPRLCGTALGTAVALLSRVASKILGVDLAAACKALEQEMGVVSDDTEAVAGYRAFTARAHRVERETWLGRTVGGLERTYLDTRCGSSSRAFAAASRFSRSSRPRESRKVI